jgi:hypothetical protein
VQGHCALVAAVAKLTECEGARDDAGRQLRRDACDCAADQGRSAGS